MSHPKKQPSKTHNNQPHGFRSERQMHLFIFKAVIIGIVALIVLHFYSISGAFFSQVTWVLKTIFISIFFGLLCVPFLNKMNRFKIPDWGGILIIYAIALWLVVLFVYAVVPILSSQVEEVTTFISKHIGESSEQEVPLANRVISYLPEFMESSEDSISSMIESNIESIWEKLTWFLANAVDQLFEQIKGLTNIIVQIALVLTMTFFFLLERRLLYEFFHELMPAKTSRYLKKKEEEVVFVLFSWMRGQLVLWVSIFIATYAGLWFLSLIGLDIEQHFALAFIAGVTEFIPYIGPLIALIPALLVGFAAGTESLIAILILYLVIQRLENNILVPVIMSKSMNLSAFTVLFVMLLGASLYGVIGILIAVPVTSILSIFYRDWIKYRRNNQIWKKS